MKNSNGSFEIKISGMDENLYTSTWILRIFFEPSDTNFQYNLQVLTFAQSIFSADGNSVNLAGGYNTWI